MAFRTSYANQTPYVIDQPEIRRKGDWVDTWDEALVLLDKEGWLRLPAVRVHPEFRSRVWSEVQKRLSVDTAKRDSRRGADPRAMARAL